MTSLQLDHAAIVVIVRDEERPLFEIGANLSKGFAAAVLNLFQDKTMCRDRTRTLLLAMRWLDTGLAAAEASLNSWIA